MRTTVTLRDEVYEQARRIAFEERRSLGDVMSDLLDVALKSAAAPTRRTLGAFEGQIEVADDFDDELPDFDEAFDEALGT